MDPEEANKFINSLVKNLQVLCHGHVSFSNSIQVIGHLYLNVDSNVNIDYIVNEKVCKNDTSSTVFVSKSYHSEPQNKSDKNTMKETSRNRTDQMHNERLNETSQDNTCGFEKNQNTGENDRKKSRKRSESQFVIHPPKIPKTSNSPTVSPLRLGVQSSEFPTTEQSSLLKNNANASPFTSPYNDGNHCVDEKPFQVIPPIDVDITSIKSEPIDSSSNDVCSFQEQTSASIQGNFHESTGDPMDDMSHDEFLIGLRDKSLGLYPVAMHPSDLNTSFVTSSQSVSQSTPSSLSISSGELVPGSSSNSALFYSPKNSTPMSMVSNSRLYSDGLMVKKKRSIITVAMKKEICRLKDDNPDLAQHEIIKHFYKKYGFWIGQSTVVGILQGRNKWLAIPDNSAYSVTRVNTY